MFMNRSTLTLFLVIACIIALHTFRIVQGSGIRGRMLPSRGVSVVMAIQGKDSVKAVPSSRGFFLPAGTGRWKLYVQAVPPYRSIEIRDVRVRAGSITNLGDIKLGL